MVRAHPELFAEAAALRLELPGRSAAQIASILYHRHGITVSERTVRGQLRRAGLHREALAAEPKAYGRYEAGAPNERWITDVLVGPWVPWPRRDGSVRARLFLIVDDHCAPRGASLYSRLSRDGLGGRSVGLMALPESERCRGQSHARKATVVPRRMGRGVARPARYG
jgi:hypothetical protein